jgi:UDP-N-acetylmuramoyl-tripeptide--D-alanyl-D-alanine ligase
VGAVVSTRITQHTLWQALTGELPPLALAPLPIQRAVLDSRDARPGDLFAALAGENTDGHNFLESVMASGARAIISEDRGLDIAEARGVAIIDCRTGRTEQRPTFPENAVQGEPLVYIVDDAVDALQRLGGFQRMHRCRSDLRVIGITGSVGKTTTKEVAAAVLRQRFNVYHSPGNLNSDEGLPLALMGLGDEYEYSVLEMGMTYLGEIQRLSELARPQVGVITNIAPVHLSRLGSIERIQQAKAELVRALPHADEGGTAILNWDDPLVREMTDWTEARVFRYGLTSDADLWADQIESAGMDGIHFRFHHQPRSGASVETLHVRVPLLGRHSVHTALRAAAVGLVEGLSWAEIVAGLQDLPSQLRLVVIPGINGSTIIDDTYNASPASTIAALNLLADLAPDSGGRRVAVLGDMRELGNMTDDGHKMVGRRAAGVVDLLVTVGELGRCIADEAMVAGLSQEKLEVMSNADEAIALLSEQLQPDDMVLVKGSRAVGMEQIVAALTIDDNIESSSKYRH